MLPAHHMQNANTTHIKQHVRCPSLTTIHVVLPLLEPNCCLKILLFFTCYTNFYFFLRAIFEDEEPFSVCVGGMSARGCCDSSRWWNFFERITQLCTCIRLRRSRSDLTRVFLQVVTVGPCVSSQKSAHTLSDQSVVTGNGPHERNNLIQPKCLESNVICCLIFFLCSG